MGSVVLFQSGDKEEFIGEYVNKEAALQLFPNAWEKKFGTGIITDKSVESLCNEKYKEDREFTVLGKDLTIIKINVKFQPGILYNGTNISKTELGKLILINKETLKPIGKFYLFNADEIQKYQVPKFLADIKSLEADYDTKDDKVRIEMLLSILEYFQKNNYLLKCNEVREHFKTYVGKLVFFEKILEDKQLEKLWFYRGLAQWICGTPSQ